MYFYYNNSTFFTPSSLSQLEFNILNINCNAYSNRPPTSAAREHTIVRIKGLLSRISTTTTHAGKQNQAGSRLNRERRIQRLLIEQDENDDDDDSDVDPESCLLRYFYANVKEAVSST